MDRSPLIQDVVAKETERNHFGQQYVLGLPVTLDDGATLSDYHDRTFTYWLMNSALIQAGVGGGFVHLSNTAAGCYFTDCNGPSNKRVLCSVRDYLVTLFTRAVMFSVVGLESSV